MLKMNIQLNKETRGVEAKLMYYAKVDELKIVQGLIDELQEHLDSNYYQKPIIDNTFKSLETSKV